MTWVRSGYCCRCGECCVGTPPMEASGPDDPLARTPPVEGYCPLFELRGAEGFCIGHEPPNQHPYYLSGCNVWPTDPSQLTDKPSCTYKFDWVD